MKIPYDFLTLPYELLTEICFFVDIDTLAKFNFTLFHKLGLTYITSKNIQKYFIDNHIFVEFKNHTVSPVYVLKVLYKLIEDKKYVNPNYFKAVLKNNYNEFNRTLVNIEYVGMIYNDKYIDLIKILLHDKRIDPSDVTDYAIRYASEKGQVETVKLLLQDKRINPSSINNQALYMASKKGHVEIVKLLLQDTRIKSIDDNMIIIEPLKRGDVEIIKLLLQDSRVDPSANNSDAIIKAVLFRRKKILKLLLQDSRVNPATNNNYAIRYALKKGLTSIVKILLEDHRINQSVKNKYITKIDPIQGYVKLISLLFRNKKTNNSDNNKTEYTLPRIKTYFLLVIVKIILFTLQYLILLMNTEVAMK